METNKLIIGIVSVMISIVILGSLLIPGIQMAQTNNKDILDNEVTNPAVTYRLDGEDDYNFSTAAVSTRGWKINGSVVDMYDVSGQIVTTNLCRIEKSGNFVSLFDATGTQVSFLKGIDNLFTADYTASTKTLTVNVYSGFESDTPTNTFTYTVENIIYYIPGGDYGAIVTNGDPDISYLVNDPSQAIAGGSYTTGDLDTAYFCEGNTIYVGNPSYTGSVSINETGYSDYTDVKSCSSFTVTIDDNGTTETFTPFTVFVPLHIEGHTTAQSNYNSLYGVIPVFIVIAILIAAVAVFLRRE